MLNLRGITAGYREGIDILHDVSLSVAEGAITAIIGPNGAGKSTILKCLFGLLAVRSGEIDFDGQRLDPLPADQRKALGIAYLPQSNSTFPYLTIEQNLRLGAWLLRRDPSAYRDRLNYVYNLFPVLSERRRVRATSLSGGQLRMLAVAKEIICPSRLLLVDEPSVGMAPKVAAELYEVLLRLPPLGVSVLLVDQNITDAVRISERVYLLSEGRVQIENTGVWFHEHVEEVISDMLRGRPNDDA